MSELPSILITGAAGGLSSLVAERLHGRFRLVGVDTRDESPGRPFPGEFLRVDYLNRKMIDVFRRNSFQALLHLGRLSVASNEVSRSQRYRVNVLGTQSLLEAALKYGVQKVVVMSTFHVYGAHQHNHIHISETDPLRASQIFPELMDAIELDHVSRVFLHQYRRMRTVILRPANIIGSRINNRITQILRAETSPVLMGYDPMLQFIHENDVATAVELAMASERSGIYNVAGEGAIAYSDAIRLAGSKAWSVPHFVAYPMIGLLARFRILFPKHLMDYFRYPTIISDAAFRRDFGFKPSVTTVEALQSLRGDLRSSK
ncbi:MAG: NAD-dependent epimerase/dehydratase family protein [Bdellovibrionales bacterium]|nr:NAD-dependent epimerase/dehydratase family protein [Bdellovibrionales bacterium]